MVNATYICPGCGTKNNMGVIDETSTALVSTYCAKMDRGLVINMAQETSASIVTTPYIAPVPAVGK